MFVIEILGIIEGDYLNFLVYDKGIGQVKDQLLEVDGYYV